jgi:hypothetical protein
LGRIETAHSSTQTSHCDLPTALSVFPPLQGDNKDFEEKLAEQLFAGEDNTDKKNVSALAATPRRPWTAPLLPFSGR